MEKNFEFEHNYTEDETITEDYYSAEQIGLEREFKNLTIE
jgi:hypothetical protein